MADALTGNPLFFDTTGATSKIDRHFEWRLIQWVDDNADIADNGNLIMTVNDVTLEATVQRAATPDGGAVLWQIGPFDSGMSINYFYLTTMSAGNLFIWV